MEILLTPEEAADRLQVKPSTIKSWLRDGKLKGLKAGKVWRIQLPELQRFLETSAAMATSV